MNLIKSKFFLTLALSFQACIFPVMGEIERITVKWDPIVCQASCVQGIVRQLAAVPGVAEILIHPDQGVVNVRWKPRMPFSFDFIKNAIGMIGPYILDARMQVRGTLLSTGSGIILESLGDNTRFVLLSPAQQSLNINVPQNSFETHRLTPQLQQQLLEGIRDSCVVTVKGPLLQWQTGGLYLVVQEATFNRLGGISVSGS